MAGSPASGQDVAIRRAELADCREVAGVHVRTWQAAYGHVFPAEVLQSISVDEREALCRRLLESDSVAVWVAHTRRRLVGFASTGPSRTEEGTGELYAIYVLPDAWGSGAAQALMVAAKKGLSREGYATAMLWVLAENPRARRFYEREGWQQAGTRVDSVRGIDVEEVHYRILLGGGS